MMNKLVNLPSTWSVKTFEELIKSGHIVDHIDGNHGEQYPRNEEFVSAGVPYIAANCIQSGRVNFRRAKFLPQERANQLRKGRAINGDVLFAHNATVGPVALLETKEPLVILSTSLTYFRCNTGLLDNRYLKVFLESPLFVNQYVKMMGQSTRDQVPITTQRKFFCVLPSISEQQEIARIFLSWDRGLEKLGGLITAKTKLKRGLMQQLLDGRKRFKEFKDHEWMSLRISDFARTTLRPTPKPDKPFKSLGIRSHGKGTFLKQDFEPQKIELTELYEVRENDLIVNITFAWEGAIAIVGSAASGALVSHRFPTYVFDTEKAIPEYFRHVIIQKWFVEKLGLISPGGAGRNRVLSKRDFAKLEVLMPSVEEQRKIAAVLNACDREIDLLQKQLAALKKQKQGLMQKLLTGQIRVKV